MTFWPGLSKPTRLANEASVAHGHDDFFFKDYSGVHSDALSSLIAWRKARDHANECSHSGPCGWPQWRFLNEIRC